jgi:phosphomannomutase
LPLRLPDELMVSVSGFRGRVGETLTPELVAGLAAAFGAFVRSTGHGHTVCLGRDSRTSGPMLARAASAGLQSVGCRVVDLGMVATPTLLMAVRHHRAAGGIGVTASHNPAEWNALKLAGHDGLFLDGEASARFRASLRQDPPRVPWDHIGEVVEDRGATERHLDAILSLDLLEVGRIRDRAFNVALDCVHGAGGALMPTLLERLGCRVHAIGTETDGRFPRDPEPTAAHLADLGRLVRKSGADLGMAVDPDVDRLSLVDEKGEAMGEDLTLAMAAAAVLSRRSGTVVTNLSTSQVVEDVARAAGGRVVRAPVGEIHVARRMQAEKAVVGGEGNGGVILPDLHHTRDAPLAAALVLQHLADQDVSVSASVARWPRYFIVKEKLAFPREALEEAYRALEGDLGADEKDSTDGLRLAWRDRRAWLHVRPSGTEPVVRLIAETPDAESARELIARASACLAGVAV